MAKKVAPHPDSFHHALERSPQPWRKLADSLWHASEIVEADAQEANRQYHALLSEKMQHLGRLRRIPNRLPKALKPLETQILSVEAKKDCLRVAAMLRAMSIENELKAAVYEVRIQRVGHIRNVEAVKTHSLNALVTELGLALGAEELTTLSSLSKMIQLGRYHVSTEYQINFGVSHHRDSALRKRLKKEIRKVIQSLKAVVP